MSKSRGRTHTISGELDQVLAAKGPVAAAERCRKILDGGGTPRGDLLLRLGDFCELSGDFDGAGDAFRAAVVAGDETIIDARCFLADWALRHGDRNEAIALLAAIQAERPADLAVYEFVGELFEDLGELATATRWFTAGAMRGMRSAEPDLYLVQRLLSGRRRVRSAQGLPEDLLDETAIELGADLYPGGLLQPA